MNPSGKKDKRGRYTAYLSAEQRVANKLASVRAYYRRNIERMREEQRKRYAGNVDKCKVATKAWQEAHKDKCKEHKAKSYAIPENKEKANARSAANRAANLDKYRARSKAWAAANPEKMRIARQNRKAQKRDRGGRLSRGLPDKLMKLQRGKCACCHTNIENAIYDLDHIDPLALGGAHEDSNIQLLCPTCNRSKSAKPPIEFMQSRGFLL